MKEVTPSALVRETCEVDQVPTPFVVELSHLSQLAALSIDDLCA